MRARYFEARNCADASVYCGDEGDDNYTWVNRIFFPCDNDPPVGNHLKPDPRLARTNVRGCCRSAEPVWLSKDEREEVPKQRSNNEERRKKKEEREKKKKKGRKRGERVSETGLASSSFLSAAALKDRGIKADLWTFI